MKKILVSGSSGIVGYGVLRSLKKAELAVCLVGTTIYEDSVAQGFCDIFVKAPLTREEGYLAWLIHTIRKHNVEFLIPCIEDDMYKWVDHIAEIESTGATVLLNTTELILLCKDKWKFHEYLSHYGLSCTIQSSLQNDYDNLVSELGLPFLLKPRRGFGSKGIIKIDKLETFLPHQRFVGENLMAQRIVGNENEEYTTSAFCDGKGGYFASMTLRRKLSKDGFTDRADVSHLDLIEPVIRRLSEIFRPLGPTNFQFRNDHGTLKLLEINPRISSSTSVRTAFGYNESAMAVEYFLDGKIPQQPQIRPGRAVRYVEDFIFYDRPNL